MATRQTGFAILASNSVRKQWIYQELPIYRYKGKITFLAFFDGFRTSHEIQKIEIIEYDELKELLDFDAVDEFRNRSLNPERPVLRGTAQNPDVLFSRKR